MSDNPSEDLSGGTDYYSGSHNVCLFRKGGRIPAERQDIVQIPADPNRSAEMLAFTHSHMCYSPVYAGMHIAMQT